MRIITIISLAFLLLFYIKTIRLEMELKQYKEQLYYYELKSNNLQNQVDKNICLK